MNNKNVVLKNLSVTYSSTPITDGLCFNKLNILNMIIEIRAVEMCIQKASEYTPNASIIHVFILLFIYKTF